MRKCRNSELLEHVWCMKSNLAVGVSGIDGKMYIKPFKLKISDGTEGGNCPVKLQCANASNLKEVGQDWVCEAPRHRNLNYPLFSSFLFVPNL